MEMQTEGERQTFLERYDKFHNRYSWPFLSRIFALRHLHMWDMQRRAAIKEGDAVLEIGAGAYPYYHTMRYSEQVGQNGRFVAVDLDSGVNNIARRRIRRRNEDDLRRGYRRSAPPEEVVTADAAHLPFSDGSFDLILANNFTGGDISEEAFRLLKPGGKIQIAFLEPAVPIAAILDRRFLRNAGFVKVQTRIGMPGFPPFINWVTTAEKPIETNSPVEVLN